MSEFNIITSKVRADSLYKLTTTQKDTIQHCLNVLEKLKESEICFDTFRDINNVIRELDYLRELFTMRVLSGLKRGDMVIT